MTSNEITNAILFLLLIFFPKINIVKPRVICIEYCASIGDELSVTVKYKDDFDRHKEHPSGFYCNASLQANIKAIKFLIIY